MRSFMAFSVFGLFTEFRLSDAMGGCRGAWVGMAEGCKGDAARAMHRIAVLSTTLGGELRGDE
ncbi:MAG: hypothetical protein DI582_11215 [Azospirillum brasilense]|nr:MAG: hypothetical protein DI582_11215 [Azospirillum brasilense]